MDNFAIVIGISEYKNAESLPAFQNDAAIMVQLLEATQKYAILQISGGKSKSELNPFLFFGSRISRFRATLCS